MHAFKTEMRTSVAKTQEVVNKGWDAALQCIDENPCCTVTEEQWTEMNSSVEEKVNIVKRK